MFFPVLVMSDVYGALGMVTKNRRASEDVPAGSRCGRLKMLS
jgi:hypothetical protein